MTEELPRKQFDRLMDDLQSEDGAPSAFGRFQLREVLGRGSFGVVWRAHDPDMDRDVALKILPPTTSRADYERFLREVRAPARLSHPGIVNVHEMGEVDGRPFLVMDLVSGTPLAQIGPTSSLRLKVEIVRELARALEAAHSAGVLHRDLKPSNILIRSDGRPVIVDFGLARTLVRDARMTQTGAVFGTPAYMSPEQAAGKTAEIDASSDLYSLGVIFYELLTGRLPFVSDTPIGLVHAILHEEPPRPRDLDSSIPAEIEAVVLKAMTKRKADRYAKAGDLARDLDAWLGTKAPRRRPWVWIALAAIVAAGVGAWWLTHRTRKPPASAEDGPASLQSLRIGNRPLRIDFGAGKDAAVAEDRNAPPLLRGIALYNLRRYSDAAAELAAAPEGTTTFTLLALAQMADGKVPQALETLGRVRDGGDDWRHLRGMCLLEMGKPAEETFQAIEEKGLREYCLGILDLVRGNRSSAAEHFRACGPSWAALFHLACATASMEPLREAVALAKKSGEWVQSRDVPSHRFRVLFRSPAFFILSPQALARDEYLKPLRDNPETDAELRRLGAP